MDEGKKKKTEKRKGAQRNCAMEFASQTRYQKMYFPFNRKPLSCGTVGSRKKKKVVSKQL